MLLGLPQFRITVMLLFFFWGCAKPCEIELLQKAQTTADISAACQFPSPEQRTPMCGLGVQATGYDGLQELYDRCDLNAIASADEFALSQGDPLLAAWSYEWMQSQSIENPEHYAKIILGDTSWAQYAPFIRLKQRPIAPVKDFQYWETEIAVEGRWGQYPYWHVDLPFENRTLALSPELSVRTVRFLLATLASPTEPLELVVLGEGLGTVELYPPHGEAKRWSMNSKGLSTDVVRLDIPNSATVTDLLQAIGNQDAQQVQLSIDHAPCYDAPNGMRCVEGHMDVNTLYVDTQPVSPEALQKCRTDKVCRDIRGSWTEAAQLCAHQGKRLPTRSEVQHTEMTSAMWTQDWDTERIEKGKRCGDSFPCWYGTQKLLNNGQSVNVKSGLGHPVYCVSERHILNSGVPFMVANPLSEPSFGPTSDEDKQLASAVQNDPIEDKGICGEDIRQRWREQVRNGGRSTTKCRDPKSYVTSNEPYRQVWHPYIKNLGGGYVGVGSDQSYDFMASQRASWGWAFDYDPNVYRLHKMMIPLVLASEAPEELVKHFEPGQAESVKALLIDYYQEDEGLLLMAFYNGYRHRLYPHYKKSLVPKVEAPEFGWLSNPDNYAHIRKMMSHGRIIPVAADMLGDQAMQSIGTQAAALDVPIRVFYVSNAPLAWGGQITEGYRNNVRVMPFDDQSVFLATYGGGGFGQKGYWHYFTASALLRRERISSQDRNETMIWDRVPGFHTEVTVAGLPARLPNSEVKK